MQTPPLHASHCLLAPAEPLSVPPWQRIWRRGGAFFRAVCWGLALLGLFAGTQAVAAPTDDHPGFWRLSSRDGLPPAVVYSIMEDRRGFLWFGTAGGLARFDGHDFRVWEPNPGDPEGLSDPGVLAIENAPNGDLWIATEGGLDRWDRNTERFSHYRHVPTDDSSLSDNTTQALATEPDGQLWIGTGRGGLNRLDPRTGRFERFSLPTDRGNGVAVPWIRCLLRDRRGALWIGTSEDGLYRFDPAARKFERFQTSAVDPRSLPDNWVTSLAEDPKGDLWIATQGGLCSLDAAREVIERHPLQADGEAEIPTKSTTAVLVDHEGQVWMGTDGAGICRYDPVSHRTTRNRHSSYASNTLVADAIRALYEDHSGDIWIGHFPEGVSHFDRPAAAFQVFYSVPGDPNSLSDSHVLSFLEEPNGDLWVGTDNGGINRWIAATKQWTAFRHSPHDPTSLGGKAALSVHRDHAGRLWVATWDGGLNRFQPETGTFVHYVPDPERPESFSSTHAWQIREDQQHQLWIGTIGGGIEQYNSERDAFVHHRYDPLDSNTVNDDIISSMLVTRAGVLWIGTPKGLARWNPTNHNWQRFSSGPVDPLTPSSHWIFDLAEDRDGTLWFTTEGGGLRHLDPKTRQVEVIRARDGLPSDILRGLLIADDNTLWIGSNRGLIQFDPKNNQVRVFDESNGLPGSLFAPHARLRISSGDFLFGTTRGFIRFNPRALVTDRQPPPVVLTSFEVFNQRIEPGRPGSPLEKSITETSRLELPARYSVLSFQFAALSFRSTARTQYRFKLEGFDRDWRAPGPELRATFTNLDPGEYRFRVRAANSDGVWNDVGATLELVIVPPWWGTWWFKAAVVFGLLGSAAAVGWAVSSHREREARRERELEIERDRTREREQTAAALRVLNQELEHRVADRTVQLSNAMRELESFSYSVSHDLRSPLRSVDGFSRVLLEDYGDKLDDEGKESLRTIRAATKRMGQLIDDLLNLARVSPATLKRTRVNLTAIAATVAEALRKAHPQRDLEFVIEPQLTTFADPRLLRIVLENLFGNACKFTSTRPHARIEFGATVRDGRRTFYVRDNGVGFNPAYAQKLFKPFKRLHDEKEFPGTGIGLATVERIILRHGGQVAAESTPNQGATFYFSIALPAPGTDPDADQPMIVTGSDSE